MFLPLDSVFVVRLFSVFLFCASIIFPRLTNSAPAAAVPPPAGVQGTAIASSNNLLEKIGVFEPINKTLTAAAAASALLVPVKPTASPGADEDDEDKVTYGQNAVYPECPSTCLNHWLGDGWCDGPCSESECGHDGGDCKDWCFADCKPAWVGDGFCDVDCFRKECDWDKDDCAKNYTMTQPIHPLAKHKVFDYSKCPSTCNPLLLHDNVCDAECNIFECNFDGEDCYHQCAPECSNPWLGDGDCDNACNVSSCDFDKGDCKICKPGCEPWMLGNGICDAQCNSPDCDHDAGDCFGVCFVAEQIDYYSEPFFYPHCRTEWKGDGYCDCFCLTEDCKMDHGDCTMYNCSDEFSVLQALDRKLNTTSSSAFEASIKSLNPATAVQGIRKIQ